MRLRRLASLCLAPAVALGASLPFALQDGDDASPETRESGPVGLSFLEIVTPDRDATCELLAGVHGLTFGEPQPMLGNARTASLACGTTLSVRAPMRSSEQPVVRPYFSTGDIEAAVRSAADSKAEIAMGATTIGEDTFAIFLHGGIQYGLWAE